MILSVFFEQSRDAVMWSKVFISIVNYHGILSIARRQSVPMINKNESQGFHWE